ncbi:MAG TPA: acetyltransferase, partial [Thermodesulfobacteriota bacterium]|nr:acetyltransferase [Thermodesulfobacteriota bacterium]
SFTEPVALMTENMDEDISSFDEGPGKKATVKRHHQKKREGLLAGAPGNTKKTEERRIAATPAARRLTEEMELNIEKIARHFDTDLIDESLVREFLGKKKVAVYGAGLGARQATELLRSQKSMTAVGLFDDNHELKGREIAGLRVLGGWKDLCETVSKGDLDGIVISLHSEHRKKVFRKIRLELPELVIMPLVDGRAIVCEGVVVSRGAFIEAGSVIGPDTYIGEDVIVDMGAVVSHDCHIGDHSHLSPGCSISGVVRLEGNVMVGVGASINSQVTIGRNVVITPGSAVVTDLPDNSVASGNPARIIGRSRRGE